MARVGPRPAARAPYRRGGGGGAEVAAPRSHDASGDGGGEDRGAPGHHRRPEAARGRADLDPVGDRRPGPRRRAGRPHRQVLGSPGRGRGRALARLAPARDRPGARAGAAACGGAPRRGRGRRRAAGATRPARGALLASRPVRRELGPGAGVPRRLPPCRRHRPLRAVRLGRPGRRGKGRRGRRAHPHLRRRGLPRPPPAWPPVRGPHLHRARRRPAPARRRRGVDVPRARPPRRDRAPGGRHHLERLHGRLRGPRQAPRPAPVRRAGWRRGPARAVQRLRLDRRRLLDRGRRRRRAARVRGVGVDFSRPRLRRLPVVRPRLGPGRAGSRRALPAGRLAVDRDPRRARAVVPRGSGPRCPPGEGVGGRGRRNPRGERSVWTTGSGRRPLRPALRRRRPPDRAEPAARAVRPLRGDVPPARRPPAPRRRVRPWAGDVGVRPRRGALAGGGAVDRVRAVQRRLLCRGLGAHRLYPACRAGARPRRDWPGPRPRGMDRGRGRARAPRLCGALHEGEHGPTPPPRLLVLLRRAGRGGREPRWLRRGDRALADRRRARDLRGRFRRRRGVRRRALQPARRARTVLAGVVRRGRRGRRPGMAWSVRRGAGAGLRHGRPGPLAGAAPGRQRLASLVRPRGRGHLAGAVLHRLAGRALVASCRRACRHRGGLLVAGPDSRRARAALAGMVQRSGWRRERGNGGDSRQVAGRGGGRRGRSPDRWLVRGPPGVEPEAAAHGGVHRPDRAGGRRHRPCDARGPAHMAAGHGVPARGGTARRVVAARVGGAAAGVAAVSARRGLVPGRHRHPDRLRGAPAEQRALRPRHHRPRGGARGVVCARAHRGRAVVCGRDHGRGSAGSLPVAVRARARGARGGRARRHRRPCRGHRRAVRTVVRRLPGRARARARAAGGLRRRRRDRRPGDRERVCRPGVGRRLRRPGSEDALPEPLGVERRGGGGEHRSGHAHRDGRQQRPRRRRHRSARLRAAGLHIGDAGPAALGDSVRARRRLHRCGDPARLAQRGHDPVRGRPRRRRPGDVGAGPGRLRVPGPPPGRRHAPLPRPRHARRCGRLGLLLPDAHGGVQPGRCARGLRSPGQRVGVLARQRHLQVPCRSLRGDRRDVHGRVLRRSLRRHASVGAHRPRHRA